MWKQLNGSVSKSLKPKCFRAKSKKKFVEPDPGQNLIFRSGPGRSRGEILLSFLGQAGTRPKFVFLLRVGPGRECYCTCRAGPSISLPISLLSNNVTSHSTQFGSSYSILSWRQILHFTLIRTYYCNKSSSKKTNLKLK